MNTTIAVIAGDGIGKEVIPAGIAVLRTRRSGGLSAPSSPSFRGAATSTASTGG